MSQKKRILIIDDEVDLTLIVKLNLENTGLYEVRAENRATRGLAAAREFKPDLVLLDVMMPDLDGGDVLAQLKGDARLKDVPVVFLTATILKEEMAKKGASIGGYPAIPKPFNADVLLQQIAKVLPPDAGSQAPPPRLRRHPRPRGPFDPRVPRNPLARRREDRNTPR